MTIQRTQYHLIGYNPVTKTDFNPKFVITDALYESEEGTNDTQTGKFVDSNPQEDHEAIPADLLEPSLQALDFILGISDPYHGFGVQISEPRNPNPVIIEDPGYRNGKKQAINYSTTLRILEKLAQERKIWFGILHQKSDKLYQYEEANEGDKHKCLNPHQIQILLGNPLPESKANSQFRAILHPYTQIGLLFETTHGQKNKITYIEESTPFIAVCINNDDLIETQSGANSEFICNECFLDLIKSNPEEAQDLYEKAVADIFHLQEQNENGQDYYWENFQEEYFNDLTCLDLQKLVQVGINKTEQAIRNILVDILIPALAPEIADNTILFSETNKFQITKFEINQNKISKIDFDLITNKDGEEKTHSICYENEKVTINEKTK